MAYCTNCGNKLEDGDKFCPHCGASVKRAPEEPRPAVRKRNFLPVAGVAAVAVAAVLLAFIFHFFDKSENKDTENAGKIVSTEAAGYEVYSNENVKFSISYPENYSVTEPRDDIVLIKEGEKGDFQVSVEYMFSTPKGAMIYSARDFDDQVNSNGDVLIDCLGTDLVNVTGYKKGRLAGKDAYEYEYELEFEGNRYTGQLSIVDSDGTCGCYSFLSMINEDSEEASVYKEQLELMRESFKITGEHQLEGHTIYSHDELGMQFAVRDEAMGKTKLSEELENAVVVYPVNKVYSEADIWIREIPYEEGEKTPEETLAHVCRPYLSEERQGEYTSQVWELDCGRHLYTGVELEYEYNGELFYGSVIVFVQDGKYWSIEMESTEEYYETCKNAVSDILYTLRFSSSGYSDRSDSTNSEAISKRGGTLVDTDRLVADLIKQIESQPGFASAGSWEPLAVVDDFNGDGVQEFLCLHEMKNGSEWVAVYELWSLGESGSKKIRFEVLYKEVGGCNGTVGVVRNNRGVYLAVLRSEPAAEYFNDYFIYHPWEKQESKLGDASVYIERHGKYGQEEDGKYILGDTRVGKAEYDAKYEEFNNWVYRLNIFKGPEGDGVKTFADMKNQL